MSGKPALTTIAAACALCLALVGCGGGAASSGSESGAESSESASATQSTSTAESTSAAEGGDSATESSASEASTGETSSSETAADASADDNHNSYFVGRWDLYETEEATHEQVAELMEQYATDEEFRAKINEAYGRDNVEFCAKFEADGTGEMDTGLELVSFTWEATNDGAVTFTSFGGDETAIHVPVTDGMFTLNGDTYAKAS